jgi:hypothetical protein
MRGFLQPARRKMSTESQTAFAALSRHRRTKLARSASTTLLKADQWASGGAVPADIATALEGALKALQSKKK